MSAWFYSLSKKQQADYIKAHPNSKFAKKKKASGSKRLSGADKIRQAARDMRAMTNKLTRDKREKVANRQVAKRKEQREATRQHALFSRIVRETDDYKRRY